MKCLDPEAFLLFIPLLAAAYWIWTRGVRRRARLDYPEGTWLAGRPRSGLPSPFRVHFFLRFLALSFLIIALARPQSVHTRTSRTVESVDMIICFDLSKSMDALDFKPNRRAVALSTVASFIDRRVDDRIGLALFSGDAFLAVPLTTDHEILKASLMESSNRYLSDGTAIGQALAVGVNHLRNSKAKSRVIILVTDGDNNMGSVDPMTAAELARGYGIKVYAIGMGKKGKVAFPLRQIDPFGREIETLQYLTDAANDELLKQIADHTGGQAFSAQDQEVLNKIFETIDRLEKTRVDINTFTRVTEKAWPFLLVAVLLILLEMFMLNTRWRKIP